MSADDIDENIPSTAPVYTSKKVSAHFLVQREFFDEVGKNLEDTDSNRAEIRKIFEKVEGNLHLSKETKDKVRSLLESKVTRSWKDLFKKRHSLAETIFGNMTLLEKEAYFELDGCKKRDDSFQEGRYEDAVESIARFIAGQTSKLNLSRGNLAALPKCIFNKHLEELDCSYNDGLIEILSEDRPCTNLKKVNFTGSGIQKFDLTRSKKLREINLTSTTLCQLQETGIEKADANRRTIAEGLPLKTQVTIVGLDCGGKGWPKNIIAEDQVDGTTLVTRFSLPPKKVF